MRISASTATQLFALLGKGLLELDAGALGSADDFVARDLEQATVHRVRDGLLLHRGVDEVHVHGVPKAANPGDWGARDVSREVSIAS